MARTTFSGPIKSETGIECTDISATGSVIVFSNLPTSDPSNAGQLWSNSGVLTVSAG